MSLKPQPLKFLALILIKLHTPKIWLSTLHHSHQILYISVDILLWNDILVSFIFYTLKMFKES